MKYELPTIGLILDYEVRSSWWSGWVSNEWLQSVAGRYFAWKAQRKFNRWQRSLCIENTITIAKRQ